MVSYPEQVNWFAVKLGKEKTGKETSMEGSYDLKMHQAY
jgi:hypothetical protein